MAFKAKLPLLLFFFGSFLLSFTSTIAYERDPEAQLQQCTSLCERQQKFREEQCKQKCVEQYKEQKREQEQHSGEGGNARDVFNIDPQREYEKCQQQCEDRRLEGTWEQVCKERCQEIKKQREQREEQEQRGGQEKQKQSDPQREYEKCQQQCEDRELEGTWEQVCKKRCEEDLRRSEEQERQEKRREQEKPEEPVDPQREYEECQSQCEDGRLEGVWKQVCKERCQEIKKRREQEKQEKQEQHDPQREYEECQRQCEDGRLKGIWKQVCKERCQEIKKRREQEKQEQHDPQREYEECQRQCEDRELEGTWEQVCKKRCEEDLRRSEEQERQEKRREQEKPEEPVDPQREYEECQRQCEDRKLEGTWEQVCKKRCQEIKKQREQEKPEEPVNPQREYEECQSQCEDGRLEGVWKQVCKERCQEIKKRREQEKQEQHEPQREYEECQRQCEDRELEGTWEQVCKKRCEEDLRRSEEQERQEKRREQEKPEEPIDPQREYEECQRQCEDRKLEGTWEQVCKERCQEIKKRREQEIQEQHSGGNNVDPQREYQQCQSRCQQQETGQEQCQQQCEEKLREQEREKQRGGGDNADPQREYQECQSRCQQQTTGQQQCQERCEERLRQQQGGRNNPYVFDEQSYTERYRTQEGRISILPKFTQRSNLHRGIENYRLAIFEANPNTFVIPNHWDADAVIYVIKGKATISMIRKQNRDSFNLERGDVIRVPAGSVVYMVNRDNSEKLQLAKLYRPVSSPGHVQEFFGVGAEEPESFYKTFSNEILEAAFNTPIDQLQRLFGQQRKGVIIRASKEQVQALSRQASSSSKGHLWPRGAGSSESRGPYNILNEKPKYSNNYGQLYEVKPKAYKQLQDLDLAVSFVNITKGAMMAPYYNTRATKLILVVEGRGRFEMVCPHLARQSQQQSPGRGEREPEQEQEQGGAHYQRVDARLSPETMFIVPTGHPVTIIASDNENLQLVAFTINAQDSKRNFLAGKDNVVNQMEKEAMELGFNIPSKEVQEIYNRQKESYFVPGPNQRQ